MVLTNLEYLPSHDVVIYTMMFLSAKIVLYGRYFKFLGGRKMKRLTKRVFTAVMVCLISCLMFATPVLAATNCFSKTTVKLNAINGGTSYSSITSGSVSEVVLPLRSWSCTVMWLVEQTRIQFMLRVRMEQ